MYIEREIHIYIYMHICRRSALTASLALGDSRQLTDALQPFRGGGGYC